MNYRYHKKNHVTDTLTYELLHATDRAAIASYEWVGKKDNVEADRSAVNAMREILNNIKYKYRDWRGREG